jgi:hypothetical protein
MWNRLFSTEKYKSIYDRYHACQQLKAMLEMVGCQRLIVGHTPQMMGANCECDGRVWRVDVGMSSGVLDAEPQVGKAAPQGMQGGIIYGAGHENAAAAGGRVVLFLEWRVWARFP